MKHRQQEGEAELKYKNLVGCWACSSGSHTKLTYYRNILDGHLRLLKRNVASLLNMASEGSTLKLKKNDIGHSNKKESK